MGSSKILSGQGPARAIAVLAVLSLCMKPVPGRAEIKLSKGMFGRGPSSLSAEFISEDTPAEVRVLIEQLLFDNARTNMAALEVLHSMGPAAAPAAPFLAGMIEGHFGSDMPNAAGHVLIRIGKLAVDSLCMALSSTDGNARRRAAYILGQIRDERATGPLLDSFVSGRGWTAELGALRRIGEPARRRVFAAMTSEHPAVRAGAARAIVAFTTMEIGHRFLGNDGGGAIHVPPGTRSQPVVEALVAALGDSDVGVRAATLHSLARVAKHCADAKVPMGEHLRAALADENPKMRLEALRLIGMTKDPKRLDVVAGMLGDADVAVRIEALRGLAGVGTDEAFDRIAGETKRTNPEARAIAVELLGYSGRPAYGPALAGMLGDRDSSVRRKAARALGLLRFSEAERQLLEIVNDVDLNVKLAAISALGRCGGRAAFNALERLTKSDDPAVADEAAKAIVERCLARDGKRAAHLRWHAPVGLPGKESDSFPYEAAWNALIVILESPRHQLHDLAADVLLRGRDKSPPSDRVLLAALASENKWVKRRAVGHLSHGGQKPDGKFLEPLRRMVAGGFGKDAGVLLLLYQMGDAETALAGCKGMLKDSYSKVGCIALGPLQKMGDAGLDMIMAHLGDPRGDIRHYAAEALARRMDNPRVAAFVRSAAESTDRHLKDGAVRIVGIKGKQESDPLLFAAALRRSIPDTGDPNRAGLVGLGARAIPAVRTKLLDGEARETRAVAAAILGEINDRSAVPALIKALADESVPVRAQAAEALGRLGDSRAVSVLIKTLGDPEPGVCEVAAAALGALKDAAAAPGLLSALSAGDWATRRSAAGALGSFGSDKTRAALIRLLADDPHWCVRRSAADALGKHKSEAAVPGLMAALSDAHWLVRRAAHAALCAVSGRNHEPTPDAWQAWWRERVAGDPNP